ncbi:phosphopantetheine adenylyltransferase [Halorussus halobius]|uniref:phosphopantetheine adenylyltransferase n=1 Tax=Halorussus halobius TaxID=1710537 RepID=UPI001091A739|nr:pantetheine-phosphate adenylyltransferase [Halorussus halobius]
MRVAVAGTFGPLHDGHRAMLREALRAGDDGVVVGLTTDEFATSTRDRSVPGYAERERVLREAVADLDEWGRNVEIRAVDDEHGFADEDPALDALVVSPETDDELVDINRRRAERGLARLDAIVVPHVRADDGERISSTRIARGEIDEHGTLL